ncbi:penicillin acylase family protein [Arthrobacter cupressi]|uniref:Penicillin amidase n=1 Tax=Arthrobacter cupressi TaxID=1045773 RepID=A0A1G8LMU9_9MICC|nr:penicillin acylase family protein [Arthrobacter cupressi]NYD77572.1 penicillin amidase [Arthrobacter cupressi]SDI57039.1 penicillin amidase [Arthrobacter cupressi]
MTSPRPAGGPAVFRDAWGIPHLWAGSAGELAFLQGRNAAIDRSWQIELERRRSEGRTAEILGPDGLHWDRFARQAQLDDTARRCFDALDDGTRLWCQSYVDGINSALDDGLRGGPEFDAAAASPEPWNPWTPMGVFLVQHILFSTFPNKLFRAHVAATLGPDAVEFFSIEAPVWSGSNAWAVHGSRTVSGAPLIAGDPHRLLELPGVYQQVRLACPEFDAVGLAFPGVPGLPHFGQNSKAAWAITNAMADYQDLYVEELRRDAGVGTVEARGPLGWEPVAVRRETIGVRGGVAEEIEVLETARGPVIAGVPDTETQRTPDDGGFERVLSLRIPARAEARLGFEALLPLLRSRSVDDVETALAAWVEPVNSVIAADSAGSVRHFLAGVVPRRNPENRKLPVPAWSAGHQWDGRVDLPRREVPGLAVSANDRAAAGGAAGDGNGVGMEFAPPHRARRITELLEVGRALGVGDMLAIHTDTLLGSLPPFRALLDSLNPDDVGPGSAALSAEAARLRERLLAWDGRMDARSRDAGLFAAWRGAFVRRLATHPVLAPLAAPHGYSPLFGPWLSVVSRAGFAVETLLARGSELGIDLKTEAAAALEDASRLPETDWGTKHTLLPIHALPGNLETELSGAAMSGVELSGIELSGDTNCVLSMESLPGVEDRSFRGSVARYVWDLADRRNSRWIVPFGASGRPGSRHFADQLPLWAAGELAQIETDWDTLVPEEFTTGPVTTEAPGRTS